MKYLALALSLVLSTPAMAQQQPQCWERSQFIQMVGQHKAQRLGTGLNQIGLLTELWVRPDGEWIIVMTRPQMDITCLATFGTGWNAYAGGIEG
jgi:hypothetical protein